MVEVDNFFLSCIHPFIPPKRYRVRVGPFASARSFLSVGKKFSEFIQKKIPAKGMRINFLDIGCGCGQVACFLKLYLKGGKYEGFDIDKEMIDWCRKNISSQNLDFQFKHINVYNKAYSYTATTQAAAGFQFPYPDSSFDVVLAKSVFTHLLQQEAENYIAQIARVLKKGGKAILTFFILTERTRKAIDREESSLPFKYSFGQCLSVSKDSPEAAVAYPEDFLMKIFEKYKLALAEPILYGYWFSKYLPNIDYQDIAILIKT